MKTVRIIVNSPSSQGAIGGIYNGLMPSMTLGCGSWGSTSVSDNVSAAHLLNVKRVSTRRNNLQWFKVPPKIYFEPQAVRYLQSMPDVHRVTVVTDATMTRLGFVDRVNRVLQRRRDPVTVQVIDDVEPEPSIDSVQRGARLMRDFRPDTIIALGGGSPMDAAKVMWLLYEQQAAGRDMDFADMRQKFSDIRKRAFRFPVPGALARLVCIPTTSGTGAEVTPFAVISDPATGKKYPLADYALTPSVAIVDPLLTTELPPALAADSGFDALTHAIEAYVSVYANDFTDGHTLGATFHIAHGRTNAVLLPHVIRYNGTVPTKLTGWPKYEHYRAPERFQDIARTLGLPAATPAEGVESVAAAVERLREAVGIEPSFRALGIDERTFLDALSQQALNAYEDQCAPANPRMPMLADMEVLMRAAYYGAGPGGPTTAGGAEGLTAAPEAAVRERAATA
jgi:acetaldehyde dehydrogenase/alcohol dehydrogenase